jgi:flagellar basal-body rod modification protein FlgD
MSSVAATSEGQGTAGVPAQQTADRAKVSKEAFLQLLVAQIRHQNPLDPADGTEFLSQLAQFSELEQMMDIRSEVAGLRSDIAAIYEAGQGTGTDTGETKNV